jgi:hypothetical protein
MMSLYVFKGNMHLIDNRILKINRKPKSNEIQTNELYNSETIFFF